MSCLSVCALLAWIEWLHYRVRMARLQADLEAQRAAESPLKGPPS